VIVERFPDDLVLAADTVVALDERILGKPADIVDARRMLGLLAGSTHFVISGVVIMRLNPPLLESECVVSTVHMRPLTNAQIENYLSTGDWQGKAGGYGIQDADPFVTRVSGCETNIVGLPMTTTRVMLERAGVYPGRR
jgi:septum formation protein